MNYKEMKYQATSLRPPEQLAKGEHKGYMFYVLSQGTHPCAYVEIPKTSRFFGTEYAKIDIECNGGLTYASSELRTADNKGWFIGWDYAHCWDYSGYYEEDTFTGNKKHTTVEMIHDCKEVIEQLIAQEAKGK